MYYISDHDLAELESMPLYNCTDKILEELPIKTPFKPKFVLRLIPNAKATHSPLNAARIAEATVDKMSEITVSMPTQLPLNTACNPNPAIAKIPEVYLSMPTQSPLNVTGNLEPAVAEIPECNLSISSQLSQSKLDSFIVPESYFGSSSGFMSRELPFSPIDAPPHSQPLSRKSSDKSNDSNRSIYSSIPSSVKDRILRTILPTQNMSKLPLVTNNYNADNYGDDNNVCQKSFVESSQTPVRKENIPLSGQLRASSIVVSSIGVFQSQSLSRKSTDTTNDSNISVQSSSTSSGSIKHPSGATNRILQTILPIDNMSASPNNHNADQTNDVQVNSACERSFVESSQTPACKENTSLWNDGSVVVSSQSPPIRKPQMARRGTLKRSTLSRDCSTSKSSKRQRTKYFSVECDHSEW